MPRARSPEREQAYAIFAEHGGHIANREIANLLGIPEKTVGGWKVKDTWNEKLNGVLQTSERSTPNRPGAPLGNKNAVANVGGPGGPVRNKKALKTGEYEAIWMDALEDDEQHLFDQVITDAATQLNEEIKLLSIRERRMMLRIKTLLAGLSEKQRRVLQERRKVKEAVQVPKGSSTRGTTMVRDTYQLVVTEVEEMEFRPIEDILRLEDALTLVQEKKLRAIEIKQRHLPDHGGEHPEKVRFVDDIDDE